MKDKSISDILDIIGRDETRIGISRHWVGKDYSRLDLIRDLKKLEETQNENA